jgi:hypothetical protein
MSLLHGLRLIMASMCRGIIGSADVSLVDVGESLPWPQVLLL